MISLPVWSLRVSLFNGGVSFQRGDAPVDKQTLVQILPFLPYRFLSELEPSLLDQGLNRVFACLSATLAITEECLLYFV